MRCKFGGIFIIVAAFVAALAFCGCSGIAVSPDIEPHLAASPDPEYSAPIDGRDEFIMPEISESFDTAQFRARVELLYTVVVYDEKKPVFVRNDPVEPIYTAATSVLERYIREDWHTSVDGEFEIVHAIHDYLVTDVDYDFELYSEYLGGADVDDDPAFHIDGVFLNRKAVCDGLSRAVVFLCAVEGVECLRITGSFASAPHAWNKVMISGEWYNLDVTSDAVYYSAGTQSKQLSHGYFLLSDESYAEFRPNGYDFAETPFVARNDYGYYDNYAPDIRIGGQSFAPVVTSRSQLKRIFSAASEQRGGIGKIELKLDFPNTVHEELADVYASDISAAYAELDDPGFDISAAVKPYFRFPNGVYLFLLYK